MFLYEKWILINELIFFLTAVEPVAILVTKLVINHTMYIPSKLNFSSAKCLPTTCISPLFALTMEEKYTNFKKKTILPHICLINLCMNNYQKKFSKIVTICESSNLLSKPISYTHKNLFLRVLTLENATLFLELKIYSILIIYSFFFQQNADWTIITVIYQPLLSHKDPKNLLIWLDNQLQMEKIYNN